MRNDQQSRFIRAAYWQGGRLGQDNVHQTDVPFGLRVMAIAAGDEHSLGLKPDGTVVTWGFDGFGQTNVPAGLSNVVAVSAGSGHSLALRSDGTVVAWGLGSDGQTNVPTGLSGVVAIAAGGYFNLALKGNGKVVAWGDNGYLQTNVPAGLTGVVAIAAGQEHSLRSSQMGRLSPGDTIWDRYLVASRTWLRSRQGTFTIWR